MPRTVPPATKRALLEFFRHNSASATARAFDLTASGVYKIAKRHGFSKARILAEKRAVAAAMAKSGKKYRSAFAAIAAEYNVSPVLVRKLVNKALLHDTALVRGLILDDLEALQNGESE